MKRRTAIRWVSLLAGLMDSSTGLLLLVIPSTALTLMGIEESGDRLPFLRFIGAFVFAVGCLYFWAFKLERSSRLIEWRIIWLATAWMRFCVGLSVGVLVIAGQLQVDWVTVAITDLALMAYQLYTRNALGKERCG